MISTLARSYKTVLKRVTSFPGVIGDRNSRVGRVINKIIFVARG